jgi:hypothetical protein
MSPAAAAAAVFVMSRRLTTRHSSCACFHIFLRESPPDEPDSLAGHRLLMIGGGMFSIKGARSSISTPACPSAAVDLSRGLADSLEGEASTTAAPTGGRRRSGIAV